jgi:hypothetical protein
METAMLVTHMRAVSRGDVFNGERIKERTGP